MCPSGVSTYSQTASTIPATKPPAEIDAAATRRTARGMSTAHSSAKKAVPMVVRTGLSPNQSMGGVLII